jgi:hypothetical protein
MELHHIDAAGDEGLDTFENCLPLCFDCHADVKTYNPRHPKGRKYTTTELRQHRDRWYNRVKNSGGTFAQPEYLELDRSVFHRLRDLLPSTGTIDYVRQHHYGEPFLALEHRSLYDYLKGCSLPEFEFIDPDLEGLRVELYERTRMFIDVVSRNTFRVDMPGLEGYLAVPAEWKNQEWERWEEAVKVINESADALCSVYDSLVRLGRRKLAVP